MQLFASPASPFARRVRVVCLEKYVPVHVVPTDVYANDPAFLMRQPLGKIPAMELDDGSVLHDSSVICEYLEARYPNPPLLADRLEVLRRDVLAVGMMEAAVRLVLERDRRPQGTQWPVWKERQEQAVYRTLAWFERYLPTHTPITLDKISLAVALEYLDFRHPHISWRLHAPQLAEWLKQWAERPSMQKTAPHLPL
jgi:glutathione S-transferase